jgi:hypothetical protein
MNYVIKYCFFFFFNDLKYTLCILDHSEAIITLFANTILIITNTILSKNNININRHNPWNLFRKKNIVTFNMILNVKCQEVRSIWLVA